VKIAHVAPFAPGRCGLYESARDLITAGRLAGHEAILIDAGIPGEKLSYGAEDRGVTACHPMAAQDADLLVTHTAPPSEVLRATPAPIIHVLHGRPESSFRMEQADPRQHPVYTLVERWARDPRYASFLTLWGEHIPYWEMVAPKEKLSALSAPPCDLDLWSEEGEQYEFPGGGEINIVVGDMHRPDGDPFHVVNALGHALAGIPGAKLHIYAMTNPVGPWQHILQWLRRQGVLGEVRGMTSGFHRILRSADAVVTGHDIGTRIVRESLAVGTPVAGPRTNRHVTARYLSHSPHCVRRAVLEALAAPRAKIRAAADAFDLRSLSFEIDAIYTQAAVSRGAVV